MRRTLLGTGFALLAAAFACGFWLYAEHRSGVLIFEGREPAALRLARARPGSEGEEARHRLPVSMFELPSDAEARVRVAASWGLRPDLSCNRERLRAELALVPETLDGLQVVWRAGAAGAERVVGEQRLAGAPVDGPGGWSRLPGPFEWRAGRAERLGATVEPTPQLGGIRSLECWFIVVAGQRTRSLGWLDAAVLAAVVIALALLLAGMWRGPVMPVGPVEPPPAWQWADVLVPLGLLASFLSFGLLVPWGAADSGRRLLEQVPFSVALGLGAALVAARRRSRAPLAVLGGRPSGHPAWIAGGVGIGVLLAAAAHRLVGSMLPNDPAVEALWVPGTVLAFGIASGIAALSEEVFWRGLAFEVAAARLGARWAVAVTALPFTATHLVDRQDHPWALGIIAVLATALGLLRARTGSLVPCLALHAAYNLTLVLLGLTAGC
jgi:membrane protease YdiL (CAAX protease family)